MCFQSKLLPPMQERRSEYWLGLEFSDFNIWHFFKLDVEVFFQVLRLSLVPWLMV